MIFIKISQNFTKSPLKIALSHRFQSTAYGMYSGSADFFCQQNRLKNDTKTVHKRRFLKRRCHFLKRLGVWPMKLQQGLPFKR